MTASEKARARNRLTRAEAIAADLAERGPTSDVRRQGKRLWDELAELRKLLGDDNARG